MTTAANMPAVPGGSWNRHISATLKLGLPLIGAQLAQLAIHTTDVVIVGQLGTNELASMVLTGQYFFTLFIFGSGFSNAAVPMAAHAVGADDKVSVRRAIRMSMWVSILFGVLAMPLFLMAEPVLLMLGQEPEVARLTGDYLGVAGWAIFPALIVMSLRAYFSALEKAGIILYLTLAVLVFNAIFAYAFVLGHFGAPRIGFMGAAWVMLAANTLGMVLAIIYVQAKPELRKYELFVRFWRADWQAFWEVVRLGFPIAITVLAEVSLFTVASLMMGWIGTIELAAHGIALQCASVSFMFPLGLAQAGTVRTGLAAGRGDWPTIRRVAITVLVMGMGLALTSAAIFMIAREGLASLFVDNNNPQTPAVIAVAGPLLIVAGLFQVADSAQAIGAGLARGLKDSTVPMIFAMISYWLIGFPTAYLLAFKFGYGGIGVWFGFVVGLSCAAISLNARFYWLLRRHLA